MQIKSIKNVNITVLFSAPLNHLSITQNDILGMFKSGDTQKDIFNFIEAPSLKVLMLPIQKKSISFEALRFVMNDMSGTEITKSPVVSDFEKVFDLGGIDKSKIVAYGFNYDVLAEMDGGKLTDLVGNKITGIPNIDIRNVEVKFSFEKKGLSHTMAITSTGREKEFLVHLNIHFSVNVVPIKALSEQIISEYKEMDVMLKDL